MDPLNRTEMLAAGPLADLLAAAVAAEAEARELAPGSSVHFERARQLKALRAAIEAARLEAPICDSEQAGEIMSVSARQATHLAVSEKVEATQRVPGGPWEFSVRSCHAYAARHRGRKSA
jgi:hypothetical protein